MRRETSLLLPIILETQVARKPCQGLQNVQISTHVCFHEPAIRLHKRNTNTNAEDPEGEFLPGA